MDPLVHRVPSVGSVVKKMMEINPDLSAQDMLELLRKSLRKQGSEAGDFASAEFIDVPLALSLAKAARKEKQ